MKTSIRTRVLVLPILVAAAACGDDDGPAGPGGRARAEAVIRDDPSRVSASTAASEGAGAPAPFTATMTTNANVAISTDGQTWVDLGSPNGITVNLQTTGDSTTVHGEVDAPLGTYAHVRLTLRGTQVTVKAGSQIGTTTLSSNVVLAVGGTDAQVVIQKQVAPVTLRTSGRTRFVFELNSEAWVTPANLQTRAVSDAEVQQSTQVAVR